MYSNIPTHVLIQEANELREFELLLGTWEEAKAKVIDAELQRRHEEIREEMEELEVLEALP